MKLEQKIGQCGQCMKVRSSDSRSGLEVRIRELTKTGKRVHSDP